MLQISFFDLEHFMMQMNVNHQWLCLWGALSVLFSHKDTHILFVNFTVIYSSCQGCISLCFCYFGKAHWI